MPMKKSKKIKHYILKFISKNNQPKKIFDFRDYLFYENNNIKKEINGKNIIKHQRIFN